MQALRQRYQSPTSIQTLAEGLADYFAAYPHPKRDDQLLSPEARQFFRSHDIVHVPDRCGTSTLDEAIVIGRPGSA